MFRRREKKKQDQKQKHYDTVEKTIQDVFIKAKKSSDFVTFKAIDEDHPLQVSFFQTLIDPTLFQQSVLKLLKEKRSEINVLEDLISIIPVENIQLNTDLNEVKEALYKGSLVFYFEKKLDKFVIVDIAFPRLGQRETNDTQNEFNVIGPKVGFIEDLGTNLHLLRDYLHTTDLIFEELVVGSRTKTNVVIAYIDGVTNPQYVETAKQRINDLDVDVFYDNAQLSQLIGDNSYTPFPLFVTTERVDRAVGALMKGQIVIISDKSSFAIIAPATLMEFYSNPEDFYLPAIVASFFKLIRIFGMLFSIFATSFYVAILTFHFEVVPKDLLGPIVYSRANVPFPPVIEVLFLEITIDLLREAGARLPSKIGQTLGIVGGIVIGQATVEAALTSNILLIVVALAALASFTTPIYKMSNAIRLLRYPFIVLASIWGGLGIYIGLVIIITHLSRLKSLGIPYLLPLFPFRTGHVKQSIIRPIYTTYEKRPSFLRPLSVIRFFAKRNRDPKEGLDTE